MSRTCPNRSCYLRHSHFLRPEYWQSRRKSQKSFQKEWRYLASARETDEDGANGTLGEDVAVDVGALVVSTQGSCVGRRRLSLGLGSAGVIDLS
ncbi:hypothetical protein K435DRAFT_165096 [Dendrothele bispora CBS 962.96]|uniref:Uncharacterized protein n=1 Tax=Dendrothele bispora (strain CBS 962.96) TaxID=1314807 RepID=A0A4S8LXA2_DENBC|nr:hypothetical protein K435DRAFT_165096 [Dendrothele bispora CBS 962.96]